MMFILAFLLSFLFEYEFRKFTVRTNRLVYQDTNELYPINISLEEFTRQSKLQPKQLPSYLLKLLFPTIGIVLGDYSIQIVLIGIILCYLSILDYFYYLTDIRYIASIFLLSLSHLLFISEIEIKLSLYNLFFTSLFFALLHLFTHYILKKESLGSGDIFLFIALSPLFTPEQMLLLVLFSCLAGLGFAFGYFCKFRCKTDRLPFIPFIAFSTLLLVLAKLPTQT